MRRSWPTSSSGEGSSTPCPCSAMTWMRVRSCLGTWGGGSPAGLVSRTRRPGCLHCVPLATCQQLGLFQGTNATVGECHLISNLPNMTHSCYMLTPRCSAFPPMATCDVVPSSAVEQWINRLAQPDDKPAGHKTGKATASKEQPYIDFQVRPFPTEHPVNIMCFGASRL